MTNKFTRFFVWPESGSERAGVYAYGRDPIEAAEEAFLEFVVLDDPPERIVLHARDERGVVQCVTVEPAFQPPFAPMEKQPEFAW